MLQKFGRLVCHPNIRKDLPAHIEEVTSWDNEECRLARYRKFRQSIGDFFYTESVYIGKEGGRNVYGLILLRKASSMIDEEARGALPHISDHEFKVMRRQAMDLLNPPGPAVVLPFKKKESA